MKKQFFFLLLLLLWMQFVEAQNNPSGHIASKVEYSQDEQAIRQLISNGIRRQHFSEDIVFASGAFSKPIVGLDNLNNATQSAGGGRTNFKETPVIERVDVAASSDMAYAYGTSKTSWDGREPFEVAFLRVFRKEGNEWKVVAQFIRPHKE